MLRARLFLALGAASVGLLVLASPAHAQSPDVPDTLFEVPLPGGLRAALDVIGDPVAADRSQFLVEFVRRHYQTPLREKVGDRTHVIQSLLAHLEASARRTGRPAQAHETVPLPLPPALWSEVVFGGQAAPDTLVIDILRSRDAALLYNGLLALDGPTRAWIAGRPDLLRDLATRRAAAFLLAAPGLRVTNETLRVPGGEPAERAWEALVGRKVTEPAAFTRALLSKDQGRLAYFFGAMGELPVASIRYALNLDSARDADRVSAAGRLYAVFGRVAARWNTHERTFWRPTFDPTLFISDLRTDDRGVPVLPGSREFWSAVFFGTDRHNTSGSGASVISGSDTVDFAWLCEQVFAGDTAELRRRYQLVLFASRVIPELTPHTAQDAIETVRAAGTYPALVAVLGRAKLKEASAFAAAARRASQISTVRDQERAHRSLDQFQGAIALLARAASRGSLPAGALSQLVSSLSAVDPGAEGDYDGRLVRWFATTLGELTSSPAQPGAVAGSVPRHVDGLDDQVLAMLAGPSAVEPRFVDWEGTRYRLDLTGAEAIRLTRVAGEHRRPYLASAGALLAIGVALSEPGLDRDRLREQLETFERVESALGWDDMDNWDGHVPPGRYRATAATLRRVERNADLRGAARLAPVLRLLADDLLARGLKELVYAVAFGHPEHAVISASEAASRHDFRRRDTGRNGAWRLPVVGKEHPRGWHISGSLLGLDVRLADLSLTRLSSRPIARKPTVGGESRRVLIEAVALVEAASLSDADSDTIVTAIRKGRARLAAARTPAEALAIADQIRLSPVRRTLLSWTVAHDPGRLIFFLSPSELLWLGLEERPVAPTLHAWGAPAEPRLGCLCLELLDRRPWETFSGRWASGAFVSAFPDLNLRLAELLADLEMPAPLLAPVLSSATLDFVNLATSRDGEDRRGLVEFVQRLDAAQVEQYLGLLTTDGPLVPIGDAPPPSVNGVRR